MNVNSNSYTFIFSIVLVVVVAAALAFTATSLAERQGLNHRAEKMQDILASIGITTVEQDGKEVFLSRDLVENSFNKYITDQLTLKADGSVNEEIKAFDVDLAQQIRKPAKDQLFPLYIANVEGKNYYILPLYGAGLWDAIWGYISLEDDLSTVVGTIFDHKGETAGLGAEITKSFFTDSFKDEKILDKDGNLVGVAVVKGYRGGNNKDDHAVDAISGATITGDGVSDMIQERLRHYVPYFQKNTDVKIQLSSN